MLTILRVVKGLSKIFIYLRFRITLITTFSTCFLNQGREPDDRVVYDLRR